MMDEVMATKLSQDTAFWAILMAGIMNKVVGYVASEKAQKKMLCPYGHLKHAPGPKANHQVAK